jgi:cobalamin biosynthesis protein CobD/CbiB
VIFVKSIIFYVLELYKRWGPAFFAAFAVLISASASIYAIWKEIFVACIVFLLSIFALILSIICFIHDVREGRKRDKEEKKDAIKKALRESVKRAHPEYTEKQIDIWMKG